MKVPNGVRTMICIVIILLLVYVLYEQQKSINRLNAILSSYQGTSLSRTNESSPPELMKRESTSNHENSVAEASGSDSDSDTDDDSHPSIFGGIRRWWYSPHKIRRRRKRRYKILPVYPPDRLWLHHRDRGFRDRDYDNQDHVRKAERAARNSEESARAAQRAADTVSRMTQHSPKPKALAAPAHNNLSVQTNAPASTTASTNNEMSAVQETKEAMDPVVSTDAAIGPATGYVHEMRRNIAYGDYGWDNSRVENIGVFPFGNPDSDMSFSYPLFEPITQASNVPDMPDTQVKGLHSPIYLD